MAKRAVIRQTIAKAKAARPTQAPGIASRLPAAQAAPGIGAGQPVGLGVAQAKPVGTTRTASTAAGGPEPLPWDATATVQEAAAQKTETDQLAGYAADEALKNEYYGLGGNANPYSQAALLQHNHEVAARADLNRGGLQLFAGSEINKQAGAQRNYSLALHNLELAKATEFAKIAQDKEASEDALGVAKGTALEGAVGRAEKVKPEAVAAPEPAPKSNAKVPKPKKGKK